MGWLMDYLEKLSLIDYANRQRHKMEHPEAYRIPKIKKDTETASGIPVEMFDNAMARQKMLHEKRMRELQEFYERSMARKEKAKANEGHEESD